MNVKTIKVSEELLGDLVDQLNSIGDNVQSVSSEYTGDQLHIVLAVDVGGEVIDRKFTFGVE